MIKARISFKLIFAALAVTVALTACTKEPTPGKVDADPKAPQIEGSRVIAVSFGNATKTDFANTEDGIAPFFEEGNQIVLCSDINNPTDANTQTCTVEIDKETKAASITTKLSGKLTAYYPASLVVKGKNGLNIYVPSDQEDGTFANANICSTTIAENATSANFENLYALFVITPPAGTKKLTIKSLRPIGDDGQRSAVERHVICGTGDDHYKITVGDGTKLIPSPCYVAMVDGVNLSDLSFEAISDAEGATGYIKGITASAIAAKAGTDVAVGSDAYKTSNAVVAGTAYTIDHNNWHEYVTVGNRKWATMNVGASKPEDAGDYFMWGEVKGHKADLSKTPSEDVYADAFLSDFSSFSLDSRYKEDLWAPDEGFSGHNTPFVVTATPEENEYVGVLWTCTFSKYTDESGGVLEFCDDAANVNWGGAWHMPTKEDVVSLNNIAEQQWTTDYNSTGTKGSVFSENGQNLFFPASGSGWGSDLKYLTYSYAWSSSYFMVEGNSIPYGIQITSYTDWRVNNPYQASRHLGLPVRAIIDDSAAVTPAPEVVPEGALSGVFTVSDDGNGDVKKVLFSQGNLYYNGTEWGFESEQYYFRTYNGKGKSDANGYSKSSGTATGNWGLFGWSTDAQYNNWGMHTQQPTSTSYTGYTDGNFRDWGEVFDSDTWRTLSYAEWQYLFGTNTRRNGKYKIGVEVCGVDNCMVLLPDVWNEDIIALENFATQTSYNDTTSPTWDEMQKGGAVCFPSAGYRGGMGVYNIGTQGRYWTSTPYGSYAVYSIFKDGSLSFVEDNASRVWGQAVRLVTNVQNE